MNNDIEELLAAANIAWQDADAKVSSGPLPDGTYQASVFRFDFKISKLDGSLRLQTEYQIVAPAKFRDRKISSFDSLTDPKYLPYTKGNLAKLGIENINPLTDLEERLATALDVVCEIAVTTTKKGDATYRNVYLNSADPTTKVERDQPAPAMGQGAAPPYTDDDIPF